MTGLLAAIDRDAKKYLIILVFFTVMLRIFSPQMIGDGGIDAMQSWHWAKGMCYGDDYQIHHRSARFAAIIPQYFAAAVFGKSPACYYIAPAIMSVILTIFLFLTARVIRGNLFAFIVTSLSLVFPQMLIDASHPRASTFSTPLLLIVLFLFLSYYRKCSRGEKPSAMLFIGAGALFTFLMYMAKEDSLYLLPSITLILFMARKKLTDVAAYGSALLALFLAETAAYHFFTQFPYGRLQVIRQGHLESLLMVPIESFSNLFDRFTLPNMQPYFTVTIICALAFGVFCVVRRWRSDKAISFIYLLIINYLALMTFVLKSVSPLVPANTFRSRYLAIIAPLLIIIIVYFFFELAAIISGKNKSSRGNAKKHNGKTFIAAVAACSALVFAGAYFNTAMSAKTTGPALYRSLNESGSLINGYLESGSPVILNISYPERFRKIIDRVNALVASGLNIEEAARRCEISAEKYRKYVARYNSADFNAAYPVYFIFYDAHSSDGKKAAMPAVYRFTDNEKIFGLLYLPGKNDPEKIAGQIKKNAGEKVLLVREKPFSAIETTFAEVKKNAK